jgi:hypothetical protein
MAGGGFFATAMKYSEIDAAKQAFDQAQDLLLRFQHELADVDSGPGVGPFDEFDASERFADYFLDNILTDWIVQSKIDSSLTTVIRMQRTVWEVLQRLAESYEIAGNTVDEMSAQRRALIEADL